MANSLMTNYGKPEKLEIHECEFSIRTEKLLNDLGVTHLGDLTKMSARDLFRHKHLGKKSLMEIRRKLAEKGLSLIGEEVDFEITKTILHDLPSMLNDLKKQTHEAMSDLRFLSHKIEQVSDHAKKLRSLEHGPMD